MRTSRTATPLPLGRMYAEAWATYRASFARVVGISVLIFVPATALNAVARHSYADVDGSGLSTIALALVVSLITTVASTVGASFYAGLVDYTVHARRHGQPQRPLRAIARDLPYWRMFALSLAVGFLIVAGLVLLVIPGFIVMTLLSIAGPLLVIERLTVRGALRRSAALTRPQFWRVVVVIVLPTFLENTLVDTVATWAGHTLLAETAIHGALAAILFAYVMLLEVHTAHWLREAQPEFLHNA